MKKLFQNVAVFYGTMVVVALVAQFFLAKTYEDDLQALDKKVAQPVDLIQKHYTDPAGLPSEVITMRLGEVMNRAQTAHEKLAEQVQFQPRPEYRIDPKSGHFGIEYNDRVKKWKDKNANRLKQITGKLAYNFDVKTGFDQQNLGRLNELLLQATVLEELLVRLEKGGALPMIDNLSAQPPRAEPFSGTLKGVKNVTRLQFEVEVSGSPAALDRFFAAIREGKGVFFVRDVEFKQGTDPQLWGERIGCKMGLEAVSLEVEKTIEFTPMTPSWATSIGR